MKLNISLALLIICVSCQQKYRQGEAIYTAYCANCHMEDGSGLALLIPPLNSADYLADQGSTVPCIIRYGSSGGLVVNGISYQEPMPSFRNLNEVELSNLINYINTAWDNSLAETSPGEIKARLDSCDVQ